MAFKIFQVWYNLKPNGDGDDNTRHAGCPVLLGSKWVANKWIHERGQEFRRPCLKDRNHESILQIPFSENYANDVF